MWLGGKARRKPSNFRMRPCAFRTPDGPPPGAVASTSTLVTAKTAAVIWLATKRR